LEQEGKLLRSWDVGKWHPVLFLAVAFLTVGCTGEDTERLGRVGHKLAQRAEALTGEAGRLSRGWQALRGELPEPDIEARVVMRLHWDKSLESVQIQVTAKDGVVELKGVVQNLEQRRRAIDLAESTAGVVQVKDGLETPTQQ
jgi:hypothetical protein